MRFKTIRYENDRLNIIDQRRLPGKFIIIESKTIGDVYNNIKTLAVRGAPAIGVFAAYGVSVCLKKVKTDDKKRFFREFDKIIMHLKESRPTAVNLFWALDRMRSVAYSNNNKPIKFIKNTLLKEAKLIHKEDEAMCKAIGINGSRLIRRGDKILTHCNAGALATAGSGTALSVIYEARREGKNISVYADETRPLLQGARLTAWELKKNGVDVTLICDNMAASLMQKGMVDKIIVGADRIAANGDAANKIGTYGLAVLAREHKIPFYVAAPSSTFDFDIGTGKSIPIEEREPQEVRAFAGVDTALKSVKVYNPAFDVTPNKLITAIITEKGVFKKPYSKSLKSIK